MTRKSPILFTAIISFFLISCSSESEKSSKTERTEKISVERNDSISAEKTDSVPAPIKKETEEPAANAKPDSSDFSKVLTFKNITFTVKAFGKGSLQRVIIQPSGLSATNQIENLETEPVENAVVGDLNADGYPELLIFTRSAGSGSYGKVIAFSVNNGKSMSRVTFPETGENASLKKGYGGHDKFSIVNNNLTQEFPVYNESDTNSKPTGLKKVVNYKLKAGEASRIFVVDQIKEIPEK